MKWSAHYRRPHVTGSSAMMNSRPGDATSQPHSPPHSKQNRDVHRYVLTPTCIKAGLGMSRFLQAHGHVANQLRRPPSRGLLQRRCKSVQDPHNIQPSWSFALFIRLLRILSPLENFSAPSEPTIAEHERLQDVQGGLRVWSDRLICWSHQLSLVYCTGASSLRLLALENC